MLEKIRDGVTAISVRTNRLGYRGESIMAIPDKALCSPTSALEIEGKNSERGAEKSFLMDSDILIAEKNWGHLFVTKIL